MKISQQTFDRMTRETFVNSFFAQLAAQGQEVGESSSDAEVRSEIWQLGENAGRFGIITMAGALVFVRIHWDLGLDCLMRMTGLRIIAEDSTLNEVNKIEQLWRLRCTILDALAS